MSKEDDCRKNAAETLELAHRAWTSTDKSRLLALTERWLDLADRIRRIARDPIGKVPPVDPLIRSKPPDRAAGLD
jgi:hypothetical protein